MRRISTPYIGVVIKHQFAGFAKFIRKKKSQSLLSPQKYYVGTDHLAPAARPRMGDCVTLAFKNVNEIAKLMFKNKNTSSLSLQSKTQR